MNFYDSFNPIQEIYLMSSYHEQRTKPNNFLTITHSTIKRSFHFAHLYIYYKDTNFTPHDKKNYENV